ncbi:zinc ABC transporter substrate-binding protein, partial [Streptomyces sp. 4F]
AVGQADVKTKIDAATLTKLEDHGSVEHDHGHGGEEHAAEEHSEEAHSEEEEHALDPHVWLDPVKYAEIAEG